MTLLVISDTHGHPQRIREALARQRTRPEAVLFLGDGLADMRRVELDGLPLVAVRGNCDIFGYGDDMPPYERTVNFDGRNIFMLHGHTRGVNGGLERAILRAAECDADVLLYGHTHVKHAERLPTGTQLGLLTLERDMYIFNPGSLGSPRDGGDGSFGLLELCRGGILTGWGGLVG